MPRNVIQSERASQRLQDRLGLVQELVAELQSAQSVGQPTINEEHFPTGAVKVLVLWDRWYMIDSEDRAAQILEAYRQVEGDGFVKRIALLDGLTFPEGYDQGLLPYQILPLVRHDDKVTLDQCRQAMIEMGASKLLNNQLRFTTIEQAEKSVLMLVERLPQSELIWQITQGVGQVLETSWSVES